MPQEDARPYSQGSLGLSSENDVLGRLGAVVSPVSGSSEVRRQLAQQRVCLVKGQPPPPSGLQEAYARKAAFAASAKALLESEEQRLAAMIPKARHDEQVEDSVVLTQQVMEVRKARISAIEAQESKCLAELSLQYNNLHAEGDDHAWNEQQSFLVAVRASALARGRNMEEGAKAMDQIKKAKVALAAAKEKAKQEEIAREMAKKQMQRPASSPSLWLPSLRSVKPCTGLSQPSSAPARTNIDDEVAKQQRDRWIQYVRQSLHSKKKGSRASTAPASPASMRRPLGETF